MPDVLLTQQKAAPTAGQADVWLLPPEQKQSDVWITQNAIQQVAGNADVYLATIPTQFGTGVINNVQSVNISAPVATATASGIAPTGSIGISAPTAGVSTYYDGFSNTAEGQPDTTVVTTVNTGSGSGDLFSSTSALANITFSADFAHTGTNSYKYTLPTSSANPYLGYQGLGLPVGQDIWSRIYFYLPAYLSQGLRVLTFHDSSATYGGGLRIQTAGTLVVANAANTTLDQSPTSVPTGQWIRAEVRYRSGASAGEIEAKVWWTNPDGTGTPDWSSLQTGQVMLAGGTDKVRTGCTSAVTQTVQSLLYIDDMNVNTITWPGPYTLTSGTASSPAPTPAATTPGVTIAPLPATATASALVPVQDVSPANTVPVATATASSLTPIQTVGIPPAAATATASSLVPIQTVNIFAPAATATASGLVPAIVLSPNISAPVATATASALVPVQTVMPFPPAATATASSPVPTLVLTVNASPPAATATASGLVPVQTVSPQAPAATATASSLVPVQAINISVPVATATASAPAPTVLTGLIVFPPAATATASSPTPSLSDNVAIPAATATASGPTPIQGVSPLAPAATGTASAPAPTLGFGALIQPPAATAVASAPTPTLINVINVNAPTATATASAPAPGFIIDIFPPTGGGGSGGGSFTGGNDQLIITSKGKILIRVAGGIYI